MLLHIKVIIFSQFHKTLQIQFPPALKILGQSHIPGAFFQLHLYFQICKSWIFFQHQCCCTGNQRCRHRCAAFDPIRKVHSRGAGTYFAARCHQVRFTYAFKRRTPSGNSRSACEQITGSYGNDLTAASRCRNTSRPGTLISRCCYYHQSLIP